MFRYMHEWMQACQYSMHTNKQGNIQLALIGRGIHSTSYDLSISIITCIPLIQINLCFTTYTVS